MKRRLIAMLLVLVTVAAMLPAAAAKDYAKEIYLYNWSEYMLPDVLADFEAEYGIRVVETTFESNDEMFAHLMAAGGKSGFDICVPSNFYVQAMIANGLLEEIDWANIPNYETNINDAYKCPTYDPTGMYTVPYMGTVACWLGNPKMLAELGVDAVNTYEDLTNPALAGYILMADDAQGNICCGLQACDLDPLSHDLNDIEQAKNWLLDMNSSIKAYSLPADVRDAMIRNEAAAGYMYSGNIMQAMRENPDLALILNDEQVSISIDCMVILKGTEHKEEAELFLNFLLRPDISARLTEAFPYVNFNDAAVPYLSEELASSELCVLSSDIQNRMFYITDFDGDAMSAEVDAMTEVKLFR